VWGLCCGSFLVLFWDLLSGSFVVGVLCWDLLGGSFAVGVFVGLALEPFEWELYYGMIMG
jgi:hypothetical protein